MGTLRKIGLTVVLFGVNMSAWIRRHIVRETVKPLPTRPLKRTITYPDGTIKELD